ncbi:MAG: aminopeptidase P family protein [Lachnospiraceae bacterium]|nr:aminopeptidase P family protein [Lachnospiraceae bacterium]
MSERAIQVYPYLVTGTSNARYYHRLPMAAGAVYVSERRKVFLNWGKNKSPDLPKQVECINIERERMAQEVSALLKEDGAKQLRVEPEIAADLYLALAREKAFGVILQAGIVETLREIKSEWEIEQLRRAAEITDSAYLQVREQIHAGQTELQVAAELEQAMRLAGSERFNLTIVAAGPNSASPHHWASDYVIQKGDFVTMDYGCTVNGYHSDLTRTIVIGKASEKQKEIYGTVLHAHDEAFRAIRAGAVSGEVDGVARTIIDGSPYKGAFIHNLGHGIGLDIHEGTGLVPGNTKVLKAGMVVSDEPGIYLDGYGGVRIEDIVLVTEEGARYLENSDRGLFETEY